MRNKIEGILEIKLSESAKTEKDIKKRLNKAISITKDIAMTYEKEIDSDVKLTIQIPYTSNLE